MNKGLMDQRIAAILGAVVIWFVLTACNKTDIGKTITDNGCGPSSNISSHEGMGRSSSGAMDTQPAASANAFSSAQTREPIKLDLKTEDLSKIEYKGVPQLNIPAQQFTKAEDIQDIVNAFNDMEITDDFTVNYDKMSGLNNRMIFSYKNGKTLEIWHIKSGGLGEGGLNIRDETSPYGMRWLQVKHAGEYLE